jgi:hypothetical protein
LTGGDGLFPPEAYERDDESPDDRFYASATKAVAGWLGTTDAQHLALVRAYFDAAGGWADVTAEDRSPGGGANPLYAVWARAS